MAVWTPVFRIFRNEADITDRWQERMVSLKVTITSGDGSQDAFEAVLDDRDFLINMPSKGVILDIFMGYEEVGLAYLGSFNVGEVYFEGPPSSMRLVGKAAGMLSVMKSPVVSQFEGKSVGDIVREVGGRGGLQVRVAPYYDSIQVPYKHQITSNWHLLQTFEKDFHAVSKVEFEELLFFERDLGQGMQVQSLPSVNLRPEHLAQWSTRITDRWEYSNVEISWRDKNTNQRRYETVPVFPGAESNMRFVDGRIYNSQEEAQAAGRSKAEAFRRNTIMGVFNLAKGDPWIRAQLPMVVGGMRDGIDGAYIIETVTHTFTKDSGILTEIEAHTPGAEGFEDPTEGGESVDDLFGGWWPGNPTQTGPN